MTKFEKYWVFGMIWMSTVKHYDNPTLWNSISNVSSYLIGTVCFVLMIWHFFVRSEK